MPGTNLRIGKWRRALQGMIATFSLGASMALAGQEEPLLRPAELTSDARSALDDKWRGWSVAAAPASPCPADGAEPLPPVNAADLDNDGRLDFIATIQTADGIRLAAIVFRPWKPEVFELDELSGDAAGTIAVAARGARFTSGTGLDDYFPATTIVVRRCDGSAMAYVWSGINFRRTPIAAHRDR